MPKRCVACKGKGYRDNRPYDICQGTGTIEAEGYPQPVACPMCHGEGKKRESCTWCKGTGIQQ